MRERDDQRKNGGKPTFPTQSFTLLRVKLTLKGIQSRGNGELQ